MATGTSGAVSVGAGAGAGAGSGGRLSTPGSEQKKKKGGFGSFFTKLKKDFKKGITEMQIGVQRMARGGADLLPSSAEKYSDQIQRYVRYVRSQLVAL